MGNVPLDAVTVEVVRAALNAAAERMRITMIKTAYNHIISESLDFGCAIFDPDVQMIAQGIGLPVFQGHLGFPIQATMRRPRARGLPRGRRLHPQRPLRGQRQPPERRRHVRAGVLGGRSSPASSR